jgi:hypothetical protein
MLARHFILGINAPINTRCVQRGTQAPSVWKKPTHRILCGLRLGKSRTCQRATDLRVDVISKIIEQKLGTMAMNASRNQGSEVYESRLIEYLRLN